MAKSEANKQKKLAKKRSKELAKKKDAAREKNRLQSFSGQWEYALAGSFAHSFVSAGVHTDNKGMGSVIVSRRGANGKVAMVRFLIDSLLLGVKDVHAEFVAPSTVSDIVDHLRERGTEDLRAAKPAYAAKVVHDAIDYARKFGLEPHPDWFKIDDIFEDLDYEDVELDFEFGKNGKPFYVPGPYDGPEDAARIMSAFINRGLPLPEFMMPADMMGDDLAALDDPELDVDIDEDAPDFFDNRFVHDDTLDDNTVDAVDVRPQVAAVKPLTS